MRQFIVACALCLNVGAATSHTETRSTTPAPGAVVAEAPEELSLRFEKPTRLATVRTVYMDHAPADLDLDDQVRFATRFEVPFVRQGKGPHRVEWRGIATDGHIMQDAFPFRIP